MQTSIRRIVTATLMAWAIAATAAHAEQVYFNDFNGPLGSEFPEWKSAIIRYKSAAGPPGSGEIAAPTVTNAESPNRAQRFLGEFGGPKIGTAADPASTRWADILQSI